MSTRRLLITVQVFLLLGFMTLAGTGCDLPIGQIQQLITSFLQYLPDIDLSVDLSPEGDIEEFELEDTDFGGPGFIDDNEADGNDSLEDPQIVGILDINETLAVDGDIASADDDDVYSFLARDDLAVIVEINTDGPVLAMGVIGKQNGNLEYIANIFSEGGSGRVIFETPVIDPTDEGTFFFIVVGSPAVGENRGDTGAYRLTVRGENLGGGEGHEDFRSLEFEEEIDGRPEPNDGQAMAVGSLDRFAAFFIFGSIQPVGVAGRTFPDLDRYVFSDAAEKTVNVFLAFDPDTVLDVQVEDGNRNPAQILDSFGGVFDNDTLDPNDDFGFVFLVLRLAPGGGGEFAQQDPADLLNVNVFSRDPETNTGYYLEVIEDLSEEEDQYVEVYWDEFDDNLEPNDSPEDAPVLGDFNEVDFIEVIGGLFPSGDVDSYAYGLGGADFPLAVTFVFPLIDFELEAERDFSLDLFPFNPAEPGVEIPFQEFFTIDFDGDLFGVLRGNVVARDIEFLIIQAYSPSGFMTGPYELDVAIGFLEDTPAG